MTTNQDRAADLLDRLHAADQMAMEGAIGYFNATAAAHALADAGLLMPDLPEKGRDGRWKVAWKVACKHFGVSHVIAIGDQVAMRTARGHLHADWDEARSLGLCLLAAADYCEGELDAVD